jgi:hypothetical protein
MALEELPIFTSFDVQRFIQFGSEDCANWTGMPAESGKKGYALYPQCGRRHVQTSGQNRLIFGTEPRLLKRSERFAYSVAGSQIFRIDRITFSKTQINPGNLIASGGLVTMDYLVAPDDTFVAFCDGQNMYIYRENAETFDLITDVPISDPQYVVTFGNRFAVAGISTSQFNLSRVNARDVSYDPSDVFPTAAVFAQERGTIKGFAVLHNTLYIFTDFTTGVWSNNPSQVFDVSFPWRKNTTYDWDFGLVNYNSLDIDFGMICFLAQNKNGLIQVMVSDGGMPKPLSTKAIDVLFETTTKDGTVSPFVSGDSVGFLYQYENTVFYRLSAGNYDDNQILYINETSPNSIEYNFMAKKWYRSIEKNGERNRAKHHVFFSNKHLVSVDGDTTVYELSGRFYVNEIRNINEPNQNSSNAYISEPMRCELVTKQIYLPDYAEFVTDYVEIDFVFGIEGSIGSDTPFQNTEFLISEDADVNGEPVYLIAEDPDNSGQPVFLISEESNTPSPDEPTYNNFFKPHIELYWSDNGGMMYYSSDVREFAQTGYYRWKMRWYQLGVSRNRTYKLVCVSPFPIVILGAVQNRRRVSGGAN